MRLVLWLLLSSLIASTVLGTGCVQKVERMTPPAESQIFTPTPHVDIKYLERPTNPPVSFPINTPIPNPTLTPLVVNEPRELLEIIEPHDGVDTAKLKILLFFQWHRVKSHLPALGMQMEQYL